MAHKSSSRPTVKLAVWLLVLVLVPHLVQAKDQPIRPSSGDDSKQRGASAENYSLEVVGAKEEANRLQLAATNKLKSKAPPLVQEEKKLKLEVVEKKLSKVVVSLKQAKDGRQSSTIADLLTSLGFEHELHNCTSLDGYTTQLVRMVNPHLKRSQLRKYPVVLYTGQGTSPAAFLAGSLQSNGGNSSGFAHNWHSSEGEDHSDEHLVGEIHHKATESRANGSLAVMLSNIGFDVWLVPTRGVDAQNRARGSSEPVKKVEAHHEQHKHHEHHKQGKHLEHHVHREHSEHSEHHEHHEHHEHREQYQQHHNHNNHTDYKLAQGNAYANSTSKPLVKRSVEEAKKDKGNLEAKLVEVKRLMKEIEIKNKPKFGAAVESDARGQSNADFDLVEGKLDLVTKLRQLIRGLDSQSYWSFSSDEIIEKEFAQQLDCVRSHSGAQKVSLISYSNGGFVVFGFMARQAPYAHQHLDTVLHLAPAVFVNKFNLPLSLAALASNLNLFDEPFPSEQLGALGRKLCQNDQIKSSACKHLLEHLYGPSEVFEGATGESHVDLEFVFERFLARPLSAKALRQSLQVAYEGRMQEYDYGLLGNFVHYEQPKPHPYELDHVKHERLFVLSGERDALVDQSSMVQLMGSIGCRPLDWLKVSHYNHLDFVLAHDKDQHVNWPVARILVDRDVELDYYRHEAADEEEDELEQDVELRDEKNKQSEANESNYDDEEDDEHDQQQQEGAKSDNYRDEDDAQGSYKSPNQQQQQQPQTQREDSYEGHTTTPTDKKSFDEEHELTDQSAEQPVRVQNSSSTLKPPPQASVRTTRQLLLLPRATPEAYPKEAANGTSSSSEPASASSSNQLPGPVEPAPCSGRLRKQIAKQ